MQKSILENALVTGADGMVGSYADFGFRTTRATLDVTDENAVRDYCRSKHPAAIVHLAAATDLARCEADPDYAYRVNVRGTYNVALAARESGAKMIYVSTSGVFDGTKSNPYAADDVPNPLNAYGRSKYLGELIVAGMLGDYCIARISWVFGGGPETDRKFVSKIIAQLDQPTITAVADKYGSPTYAKDAIAHIRRLVERDARGIFHISNTGRATRADIAREIVRITGSAARVADVPASRFAISYPTGENESMEVNVPDTRPWQEALREYIEVEWPDAIRK